MSRYSRRPEGKLGNLPTIKSEKLKNGFAGNLQTIDLMKKVSQARKGHPLIRQLAVNILDFYSVESHNSLDESKAIGAYVRDKLRYTKDPQGLEMLQDPIKMIRDIENNQGHGDCDDHAILVATLLLAVGIQPYFKIVRYPSSSSGFQHIYVCVTESNYNMPREYLCLDAIIKDEPMGYEVPQIASKIFKV